MRESEPVALTRDLEVVEIPAGTKATLPAGSQFFFDKTGSADKTIKLYEGHYHDLLADLGKESAMADIISWIDQRIPAKPGPHLVR